MAEPVAVIPGGDAAGSDAPSDAPPAFAFEARRARMDWRAIHAVDVDRMMRENDIDTLESVLVRPWLVPSGSIHTRSHDDTRTSRRAARSVRSRHARTRSAARPRRSTTRDGFGFRKPFRERPTFRSARFHTWALVPSGEETRKRMVFYEGTYSTARP